MDPHLASTVDARAVADRSRPQRALRETWRPAPGDDHASDAAALVVTVHRACGTVEVRVSGPGARLRLFFDPSELPPADGQSVVRTAVARYRSSLLRSAP